MRPILLLLVILTACASPPSRPLEPPAEPKAIATAAPTSAAPAPLVIVSFTPIRDAVCTSVGGAGRTLGNGITLRLHGRRFAHVSGALGGIQIHLAAGSAGGTIGLARADEELVGEVRLDELPIRPRARSPVKGSLVIDDALIVNVDRSGVTYEAELPWPFVQRKADLITSTCAEIEALVREEIVDEKGKRVFFKPGAHARFRAADGAWQGELRVPPRVEDWRPITVLEIERRGKDARVRISAEHTSVEGFVPADVLTSTLPDRDVGRTGGIAIPPPTLVRCRADAQVYVRDGVTVWVGVVRKDVDLLVETGRPSANAGEIAIDLGVGDATDSLVPFIERSVCAPIAE